MNASTYVLDTVLGSMCNYMAIYTPFVRKKCLETAYILDIVIHTLVEKRSVSVHKMTDFRRFFEYTKEKHPFDGVLLQIQGNLLAHTDSIRT